MTMTPKQEYERRRAAREAKRTTSEKRYGRPDIVDERDVFIDDLMDRFVTSIERIADALEVISQPPKADPKKRSARRPPEDRDEPGAISARNHLNR